jgi:hypothetical protein
MAKRAVSKSRSGKYEKAMAEVRWKLADALVAHSKKHSKWLAEARKTLDISDFRPDQIRGKRMGISGIEIGVLIDQAGLSIDKILEDDIHKEAFVELCRAS